MCFKQAGPVGIANNCFVSKEEERIDTVWAPNFSTTAFILEFPYLRIGGGAQRDTNQRIPIVIWLT